MKFVLLDEESNTKIALFLLRNVKDSGALKQKITSAELDCCAIKPAIVIHHFQLLVAANKAVIDKKNGKLKTKSLNTELLYNLSISKNISQSLHSFGFDEKDKHVCIVVFEENGVEKLESIRKHLEGEICNIEEVTSLSDIDLIKKAYKITEKELEVSTLLNSVVSRISTKNFGSY